MIVDGASSHSEGLAALTKISEPDRFNKVDYTYSDNDREQNLSLPI